MEDWKLEEERVETHAGKNDTDLDREHYWKGVGSTELREELLKEWNREILLAIQKKSQTLGEKECCAEHVLRVWNEIAQFIQVTLSKGKGVRICGLGTFTFKLSKREKSKHFYEFLKTPLFIPSDIIVQMFDLESPEDESNVCIPIIPLNLMVIARKVKISRAIVEGVVTEVLQAFARGIICDKNIEFPFSGIGKLQVKGREVKMRFYQEFYKKLSFNVDHSTLDELEPEEDVIPGRMTPLLHHIPTPDFRSVFHLREVRSVHSLIPSERSADPKLPPNCQVIQVRKMIDSEDEEFGDSEESLTEERVIYKAKPLFNMKSTGKHLVDLILSRGVYFNRFLKDHHLHLTSRVLGIEEIRKHVHLGRANKEEMLDF